MMLIRKVKNFEFFEIVLLEVLQILPVRDAKKIQFRGKIKYDGAKTFFAFM